MYLSLFFSWPSRFQPLNQDWISESVTENSHHCARTLLSEQCTKKQQQRPPMPNLDAKWRHCHRALFVLLLPLLANLCFLCLVCFLLIRSDTLKLVVLDHRVCFLDVVLVFLSVVKGTCVVIRQPDQ